MNDRELLELAARAAGINIIWEEPEEGDGWCFIPNQPPDKRRRRDDHYDGVVWNPLTDPADALRLAVALHLAIEIDDEEHEVRVFPTKYDSMNSSSAVEYIGNNAIAATMRAITRAAAEIGRAKT